MKQPWMSETQQKNLAWFLPRPKLDKRVGGMPRYAEEWLLGLARHILGNPDAEVLSLFCGTCEQGFRVDVDPKVKPDLLCDVHYLTKYLKRTFDIILADPPYNSHYSKTMYGTGKINYRRWTAEANRLLNPGGLLIVYHERLMMNPYPKLYTVVKRVAIMWSTHHTARIAIYFQKRI